MVSQRLPWWAQREPVRRSPGIPGISWYSVVNPDRSREILWENHRIPWHAVGPFRQSLKQSHRVLMGVFVGHPVESDGLR